MGRIACIRGATTVAENCKNEIFAKTQELIAALLACNNLTTDMIASCIFSSTVDIDEAYPASAVTQSGLLVGVPLFSTLEPNIKGALKLCIRAMLTVCCDQDFQPKHIYLHDAANLRTNFGQKTINEVT